MIVQPLDEKRRPKPVAIIMAAGLRSLLVDDEDEGMVEVRGRYACVEALQRYRRHQVYTLTKATALLPTTGAGCWEGYQWRGALVRLKLDGGPTIYPIRRAIGAMGMYEATAAVRACIEWLAGLGINPGSLGSMAWRLWRSTLDRPVRLGGPTSLRAGLYGGRQEAPWPGSYSAARYMDLSAAYPTTMAGEPYPSRMRRVAPTVALEGAVGFARAAVRIPESEWCPLPVRVAPGALSYGWGKAEGVWTWRELQLARDAGCRVDVLEAWAGMRSLDLFGPWWQIAKQGRAMPDAAPIVKAITSSLWGQFALEADGGRWVRWADEWGRRAVVVRDERRGMLPQAQLAYIAADTTSRVRDRLYREALAVLPDAIYADTDAVICGRLDGPDTPGWRPKAIMTTVDIRGPQCFRWLCPTCEEDHAKWHYCVAGCPTPDLAAQIFRREGRGNVASMTPGEITLPRSNLDELRARLARKEHQCPTTI